jgi:hypothetical protein
MYEMMQCIKVVQCMKTGIDMQVGLNSPGLDSYIYSELRTEVKIHIKLKTSFANVLVGLVVHYILHQLVLMFDWKGNILHKTFT